MMDYEPPFHMADRQPANCAVCPFTIASLWSLPLRGRLSAAQRASAQEYPIQE